MISFIQQILQKHNKWILGTLLGVIIIAFVFTIGATPGIVGKKKTQMFYNINLMSRKDTQPAADSTVIATILSGRWLGSQEQLSNAILARIALLAKADELLIPQPNDDVLAGYIKTVNTLCDNSGKFLEKNYQDFLGICEKYGFTKHAVKQALMDNYRIEALKRAVVGNGYYADHQLQAMLAIFYSSYDVLVGELKYDAFGYSDLITEEEMRTFYDQHAGRYKIPEMLAVSIVRFETDQSQIKTPSKEVLEKFFASNKRKFETFETYDAARDQVLKEYVASEARKLSGKKAGDFVYTLYNDGIKLNTDEFQTLLKNFGVSKEKIAAYSRLKLPVVEGVPEAALSAVFELDGTRYYSDPFQTDSGAAVLLVEGKKEVRALPFEESREYLEMDIVADKKKEKFTHLVQELKNNLSQCSSKQEFVQQLRQYDVAYQKYKNISLNVDPSVIPSDCWEALSGLPDGEKVGFVQRDNGDAVFVIVLRRETPDLQNMLEQNAGKFKQKLLLNNREFEFLEYTNELIQKGLSNLK